MKNDKGFTLIELIICIVIFGIIVAAVFGFMISGSKSYETVNGRINLQMDSQLTLNFINEYLIDCDTAVYSDGSNMLCIIDKASGGGYNAYVFRYIDTDTTLYFSKSVSVTPNADGSFACVMGTPEILSDMVDSFLVTLGIIVDENTTRVGSVKMELSFNNSSTNKTFSHTVSLRNKPKSAIITFT